MIDMLSYLYLKVKTIDDVIGCDLHFNREKNLASLRALDGDLEGLFSTWLSPACLELHRITWNDPACLLEKIVTYEVGGSGYKSLWNGGLQ
jgi:hypothetical protein